jgi:sulfite exporter TauE/SafE
MLTAAFLLGFAGSFHCLLMCAPLTLAGAMAGEVRVSYLVEKLLYNGGRIFTYTMLGAALGASKELFGAMVFDVHGAQEWLSITLGCGILAATLLPKHLQAKVFGIPVIMRLLGKLRKQISSLMRSSRLGCQCAFGLLNGLLPCGFVYMGLAMAALSGSTTNAAATMCAFGLGTIPAMFGAALLMRFGRMHQRFASGLHRLAPLAAALVAVLFIVRGLALGIPYLSPKLAAHPAGVEAGCGVIR